MIISQIHVRRFRSIFDETLECASMTTIIGRNGAGKSGFIQALRLFMDTALTATNEDFYNRDLTEKILVEVTFTELTSEERSEFASYLDGDSLVVQRQFPGGEYYGRVVGCEDFEPIRTRLRQKDKVSDVAPDLKRLVESGKYPGLKAVGRNIEDELTRFETENPAVCKPYYRAGLFQGPTNIAGGKLRNRSQFVYVAPVREADADATGTGRQSALSSLVAPLVKAITDGNASVKAARESLESGYTAYKGAIESAPEKETLGSDLTKLLQRYEIDTSALIQLEMGEKLALPQAIPEIWLFEDGFCGKVARKGHGLQRLFIFSILELYEKFRSGSLGDSASGNMVLAIEEPELYQHPARARALADVLRNLSTRDPSRTFQFQVFLTTHSPYFVRLEDFEGIRRVEKVACDPGPKQSKIWRTDLRTVGNDVLNALGRATDATELSSWARLRSVVGPKASEGFFADGVILVEGDEDEAIVSASAEAKRVSLDAAGITVVQAGGKTKLPNLLALYRRLGIKVFVVFDADCSSEDPKPEYNEALLKMIGEAAESRPATRIFTSGAVWNTTLVDAARNDFGAVNWDSAFADARKEYSLSADQAKKKFAVVWRTASTLLGKGMPCEALESLWRALAAHFALEPKNPAAAGPVHS